jgi:5-keto-L-gluconate epimerase
MNIEEPSIEGSIREAGGLIFHFHYADSNRWYPGAGHLDFPSIMESLYATGYRGFISGEHRPDPQPLTAAREGLAYMRRLQEKLQLP